MPTLEPKHLAEIERGEPVYRGLAAFAGSILGLTTRSEWSGLENIPRGGCLVVANHISDIDPVTLGWALIHGAGRYPRFIGKEELWHLPVIGWLARECGQVPVVRDSESAHNVIDAAGTAIAQGKLIAIYPEGGVSRDPDSWPMKPRTGAARIALATGCPVIPVGQWGAQEWLPPFSKVPHPFPRKRVQIRAGAPLDLSAFEGRDVTHELLVEASEYITTEITKIVAELRGEQPPATRHVWHRRGEAPKPVEPRPGFEDRA